MLNMMDEAKKVGINFEIKQASVMSSRLTAELKGEHAAGRAIKFFASLGCDVTKGCAAGQTDPDLTWDGKPATAHSWIIRDSESGRYLGAVLTADNVPDYAYVTMAES